MLIWTYMHTIDIAFAIFNSSIGIFYKDPLRDRKLLLSKREIFKLFGMIKQQGYSLIPISIYFKGSLVKVQLGIGIGKKLYDKRQDIAKKDAEMKIRRAMREK
ncbi:MAG: SsrA-binding protein [Clostridia bacterium]|nr:SsrA-binding protein [Clostridia bacterium]